MKIVPPRGTPWMAPFFGPRFSGEIAQSQRISVADVLATACAEHVKAWERLAGRTRQGDRTKYLEVLAKVPDAEPEEHDRYGSPI